GTPACATTARMLKVATSAMRCARAVRLISHPPPARRGLAGPRRRWLAVPSLDPDDLEAHPRHAPFHHVEGARGVVAEIKDSSGDVRAAIVDPYLDDPAILEILHLEPRSEWEGAVRGRQLRHVERHARCGRSALVNVPVPRGQADLSPCRDRSR